MNQTTLDITEGRRRRDEGKKKVAAKNVAFLTMARQFAKRYSIEHGSVTIDHVRKWAEESGIEPTHHNALGSVFRCNDWVAISVVQSSQVQRHAGLVRLWRYVGK